MGRKWWTRGSVSISIKSILQSLPRGFAWSRSKALILVFCIFMVLPTDLMSQTSIVCSGGLASFEEYQPIMYPRLARRAGIYRNFSLEITIMPGGKFSYRVLDAVKDKKFMDYQLQEAVESSFSGWRFVNNTSENINLKLSIIFELSRRVQFYDDIAKNSIIFDQNGITIKVIATYIIPKV